MPEQHAELQHLVEVMTTSDQRVPFDGNNIRQLHRVIIAKSMQANWQRLRQLIAYRCSSNHPHRSACQRARCSRPFVSGIQSVDESLRTATSGKQIRARTFCRSQTSFSTSDCTAHHGVDPCCDCDDPPCFSRLCLLSAAWLRYFTAHDWHRRWATHVDDRHLHRCRQAWILGIVSNGTRRIDFGLHSLAVTIRLAGYSVRYLGPETSSRSRDPRGVP